MRKLIFILSFIGVLAAATVAYVSGVVHPALPPAFAPPTNPYPAGIYAEGIIESDQASGENVNVYPEVPGTVTAVAVKEGQQVKKGDVLLRLDDSVQRATAEQLQSQAEAALAQLNGLKAQPRKEALDVAEAQVAAAQAALKTAQDAWEKQHAAYALNAKAVSKDALDTAANAVTAARAALGVAEKQRDLTKAGAWRYDIENQEKQYAALNKAYLAASALLAKYTLVAPGDGIVLAVTPAVGGFVSTQGSYDSYTQGMAPALVLGSPRRQLNVRCYVDEILVPRLPEPAKINAQLSVRGSVVKIPLTFVRMQPLVSPKIQLSDQRLEQVDVRVLPVIFRLEIPEGVILYPGQLADIYIGE
jgi:HlyD family secretion protein